MKVSANNTRSAINVCARQICMEKGSNRMVRGIGSVWVSSLKGEKVQLGLPRVSPQVNEKRNLS
jgi:hypothetical protein